jgi:4-hydroxy-tetrahydrodipicolinate reductase
MGELGEAILGPGCQVLLDLSHRTICAENAELASQNKIAYVTGVTGIDSEGLDRIKVATESAKVAGYVIPNFAIGAVLMMVLSRTAARFMPDVEIIESHHEKKEDAPSGTALATAKIIAAARLNPPTVLPQPYLKVPGARGAVSDLVPIHSVRLPGLLAHQEVIFGAEGETLTIRHDSLSRNSFLGGVKMACSQALIRPEFLIGLDRLLFADS